MTSPQVLKAGPLEGQLQAQTKWTFVLPKNIYQRVSAWYVPGSKAATEGETRRPLPSGSLRSRVEDAKYKTN